MAAKPLPSQEVLRQLLDYDPETGVLRWKERGPEWFKSSWMADRWNARYAGQPAFTAYDDGCGYYRGTLFGKSYFAHRIIIKMMVGEEPPMVDHQDGDGSNNTWGNLVSATYATNVRNRAIVANNTSGTMGVAWHKRAGKWEVSINGKYLGLFSNLDAAVAARKNAEREYGFHENHGRQSRRQRNPPKRTL